MTKRLLLLLALLLAPGVASAQTTWSINPTTGTVILDNVTITDTLMELGVTVDLQLDKQATGGAAQCLQVGSTGLVTKTGSACGGTGSSPGGANTNVQYNSSGTFAGDTSFTFNSGSKLVTVFDLLITDQATGGANQGLQIDTSGNVTKTGGIPAIPSGALTNHAVLAGRGTTSFGPLSLLTNGQFLIGSTGADPVAASITTSSLTAASGAGTFSLNTPTITSGQVVIGGGSGPYTGLNITGLVLAQGAGAAIVYPGSTCSAGQFATGNSASGVLACSTPTGSGNVNAGGALTLNQIVLGQGSTNVATLGTLGSATTVLHGNAAGAPTFGAVNLATDVTGVLGVTNGGLGIASGTTGGVPYFTASTVIAASGQWVNHAVVVGGGAVQAPHTIATGTTGQFLQSQGAGSDPVWAAIGASTLATSTFASLPAPSGSWGPVRLVTDSIRGLFEDTHNTSPAVDQWVATNKPCNVGLFGALSDGASHVGNDTAIRNAIAVCGTVFIPKNTLWEPGSGVAIPAGRYIGEDSSVIIRATGGNISMATNSYIENVTLDDISNLSNYTRLVSNTSGANRNPAGGANPGISFISQGNPGGTGETNTFAVINYNGGAAYYAQLEDGTGTGSGGFDVFTHSTNMASIPIRVAHQTSTFAGNLLELWGQYGGTGSFIGRFVQIRNNGVDKFFIDSLGDTTLRGGLEIGSPTGGNPGTGNVNISSVYAVNGNLGLTATKTVRAAGGASDCTLIFTGGILTGGTC